MRRAIDFLFDDVLGSRLDASEGDVEGDVALGSTGNTSAAVRATQRDKRRMDGLLQQIRDGTFSGDLSTID